MSEEMFNHVEVTMFCLSLVRCVFIIKAGQNMFIITSL